MNYICCLKVCYKESFGYLRNIFVMASPGQRRGSCGHVMAGFDLHKKCDKRDKKMGDDPCVKGQHCDLCDSFSNSQKGMLATPQYQIRKDKKAGTLVSPSKVTVVGPVDDQTDFEMVRMRRNGLLPVLPRLPLVKQVLEILSPVRTLNY